MTKAKEIVEKIEVSNVGNTKPPQWDGQKGDSYLMWKIKYTAHMVMSGLDDALNPDFERELPTNSQSTSETRLNAFVKMGFNWFRLGGPAQSFPHFFFLAGGLIF
jgi:hypothetical protein